MDGIRAHGGDNAAAGILTREWVLAVFAAVALMAYAFGTVRLAKWYGKREAQAQSLGRGINPADNVHVERTRGFYAGLALAAWIVVAALVR